MRCAFAPPVAFVYNPLDYAREAYAAYAARFGGARKEALFVGMNPGPFGMAQTGVPFGEVASVRDWLGIRTPIGKPPREHPKRPVTGFECHRSEVSGQRLWGWARRRFGTPRRVLRALLRRQLLSAALSRRLRPQPAARQARRRRAAGDRGASATRRCARPCRARRRAACSASAASRSAAPASRSPDWASRSARSAPEPGEPGGQPRLGRAGRARDHRLRRRVAGAAVARRGGHLGPSRETAAARRPRLDAQAMSAA